jgi:hypothetical protein
LVVDKFDLVVPEVDSVLPRWVRRERERERECEREMPHYVRFKCRSEQLVRIYQISFSLFSTMADTAVLPAPAPARPARRAPATPNNGISRHIEALKMEEKALKARKIITNKEKKNAGRRLKTAKETAKRLTRSQMLDLVESGMYAAEN